VAGIRYSLVFHPPDMERKQQAPVDRHHHVDQLSLGELEGADRFPELVAGFHVEYSGAGFTLFFLAEYSAMTLVAALTAILFFGGWLSPFEGWAWAEGLPVLDSGIHWWVLKTAFFMYCFLWFRATFPRYRYDQIMRLGWKAFIPVTLIWIFVLGVAQHLIGVVR